MRLILLGAPGAGKGTQAAFIKEKYNIPHISTGDIFRQNISEKTSLGIEAEKYIQKGLLVPDEVTINMVKDRLSKDDCKNGFLLDGFPRTLVQAKALESFLNDTNKPLDAVLLINVPEDKILDRAIGRRVCPKCGASYHIKFMPSKVEGKCDKCGSNLIQRKDDNELTVKERLNTYNSQTAPLIDFYKDKNLLVEVNGDADVDVVFKNACKLLNKCK